MNVLELFAGTRSVGKIAQKRGHNVFSIDILPFPNIDLVADISKIELQNLDFKPDLVWASPPCTTYSIAAGRFHRINGKAISELALKHDEMIKQLMLQLQKINVPYFVENPRGHLRSLPFMKSYDRRTVWYCRYGYKWAKPTDIWSNHFRSLFNPNGFNPRNECFNGNIFCNHEKAPRNGKKNGVVNSSQGINRSVIPEQLCIEVIKSVES